MLRRTLLALAVAAAFGLGSDAKAALLFTFSSAATVPPGGVDVQPTTVVTYTGNTGGTDAMGGGSDIKVSFIALSSPTPGVGVIASPFTFDITITDLTTGGVGVFTLSGSLSGTVTPDSSSITFTFSGSDTQVLTGAGGSIKYTVAAKFVDVPTVEIGGVTKLGSITAHVTAMPVPEPATVAMAALTLPAGLVLVRRRSRRSS